MFRNGRIFNIEFFNGKLRHDLLLDMVLNPEDNPEHGGRSYTEAELDAILLAYSLINGTRAFTGEVGGIFPTLSGSLATKEYVDSAITFIEEYYFGDTASDIGGIYFDMIDMPTGEAESEHSTAGITNADDQPLVNFATVAGVPGLITLDAGIYGGSIHALKSAGGQRAVQIYYSIYSSMLPPFYLLYVRGLPRNHLLPFEPLE